MCVSHHGFCLSPTEKYLEIFFFSDLMYFRLTQRACLNSHLEDVPALNTHLEESPLASRERRETPDERLLARGDYLQETPCESPLKRLLAKGDSLRETPRERDSSPETLCKRDCKRDSWRETPCEILNNQIDHVEGGWK